METSEWWLSSSASVSESLPSHWGIKKEKNVLFSSPQSCERPAPPIIKIISSQRQKLAGFEREVSNNSLPSEILMHSVAAFME